MVDRPFYLECYRCCCNFCFSSYIAVDETNVYPKLVSNRLVSNESIMVPTDFLRKSSFNWFPKMKGVDCSCEAKMEGLILIIPSKLRGQLEHRTELKLSSHLPNCIMSDLFRDLFLAFRSLIESEISEQANKSLQKCQAQYLRYCKVSRDKNPQSSNKIGSPSFDGHGFHAQLDCKLTYGNKNQT